MKPRDLWRRADPKQPLGTPMGPGTFVYAFALAFATSAGLTQSVARTFKHAAELGPTWLPAVGIPVAWVGGAILCAVLAAVVASQRDLETVVRRKRIAGALIGLVFCLYLATSPLYAPHQFFLWWFDLRADPALGAFFRQRAMIGGAIYAIAVIALLAARAAWPRERNLPDLGGSARWAKHEDLDRAGLLASSGAGVFLGLWREGRKRFFIRETKPVHVFVQAPARSGKGVGVVVPTILAWPGHVVVSGKLTELESATRGFRGTRGPVWTFSPAYDRDSYNPLLDLRPGDAAEEDVAALAHSIGHPDSDRRSVGDSDIWKRGATKFVEGLIHYVAATVPTPTLARCYDLASNGDETLEAMASSPDRRVAAPAAALRDMADRTRSSILLSVQDGLAPFRRTSIRRATGSCDFQLADLLYGRRPGTLYLDTSDDTTEGRGVLRLLMQQLFTRVKAPDNQLPAEEGGAASGALSYPLLFLLDEFKQFGYMDVIERNLEVVPGFGVRFCFVVQNLPAHLREWAQQGRSDPLLASCQTVVTYGGLDRETCAAFSEMAGKTTEHYVTRTKRREVFDPLDRHVQMTPQYASRDLITPDELRQLPPGEVVIIRRQTPPIRTEHVQYYKEQVLLDRSKVAIDERRHKHTRLAAKLEELEARYPEQFDWGGDASAWLRAYAATRHFAKRHPGTPFPSAIRSRFASEAEVGRGRDQLDLAIFLLRQVLDRKVAEKREGVAVFELLLDLLPSPVPDDDEFALWEHPTVAAHALLAAAADARGRHWHGLLPEGLLQTVRTVLEVLGKRFPCKVEDLPRLDEDLVLGVQEIAPEDRRFEEPAIRGWLFLLTAAIRVDRRLPGLAEVRFYRELEAWEQGYPVGELEPWWQAMLEFLVTLERAVDFDGDAVQESAAAQLELPRSMARAMQAEEPEQWLATGRVLSRFVDALPRSSAVLGKFRLWLGEDPHEIVDALRATEELDISEVKTKPEGAKVDA